MTLPDYIAKIGDEQAARLFEVSIRTIGSWRRRERFPGRDNIKLILERANGKVTLRDLYKD